MTEVVIPTFRRPGELIEAISSVLRQQEASTEVFVIDDSPEGSAEKAIKGLSDSRIGAAFRASRVVTSWQRWRRRGIRFALRCIGSPRVTGSTKLLRSLIARPCSKRIIPQRYVE